MLNCLFHENNSWQENPPRAVEYKGIASGSESPWAAESASLEEWSGGGSLIDLLYSSLMARWETQGDFDVTQ